VITGQQTMCSQVDILNTPSLDRLVDELASGVNVGLCNPLKSGNEDKVRSLQVAGDLDGLMNAGFGPRHSQYGTAGKYEMKNK
jgi:hypothetical protein